MAAAARFVATKHFTYGGHEVFPGEYLDPQGLRHDRLLFAGDSRYAMPAPRGGERWPCDRCGRVFATEGQLRGHQRSAYSTEALSPQKAAQRRETGDARTKRALEEETLADLARMQGHAVEEGRDVPTIKR